MSDKIKKLYGVVMVLNKKVIVASVFLCCVYANSLFAQNNTNNTNNTINANKLAAQSSSSVAEQMLRVKMSVKPMDLTAKPTREDLIAAGQLGGHLFPTAESSGIADDKLQAMRGQFGSAIQSWNHHEYKQAYQSFKNYIKKYPDSPWAGEAELHMACEARYNGRYTEAESTFKDLLNKYSDKSYAGAKMLANKAKSRLAVLKILQNNTRTRPIIRLFF